MKNKIIASAFLFYSNSVLSSEIDSIITYIDNNTQNKENLQSNLGPSEIKLSYNNTNMINGSIDYFAQKPQTLQSINIKSDVDLPPSTFLEKANKARLLKQYEVALEYYYRALEDESLKKQSLLGIAITLYKLGLKEESKKIYLELIKENYSPESLNNYLVLLAETSSPFASIEELDYLKHLNPNMHAIYAQLAIIYSRLGLWNQAFDEMHRAIYLSNNNYSYIYNLAIISENMGNKQYAVKLYKKIIDNYHNISNLPVSVGDLQNKIIHLINS